MFEILQDLKEIGINASDPERNLLLINKMREGSEEARNEFVLRNIPLVAYISHTFVNRSPRYSYLKDDLFSEGLLTLTEISDQITSVINLYAHQAYLSRSIYNSLLRVIKKESRDFEEPLSRGKQACLSYNPTAEAELRQDLECLPKKFCEIVRLRHAGYTYTEIGNRINCSKDTVMRRLLKTKNLLEQKYEDQ